MNKSSEAPISVSYSVITKNNFSPLFTIRGEDKESLIASINALQDALPNLIAFESYLAANGITSKESKSFAPIRKTESNTHAPAQKNNDEELVEGRLCPKCNAPVLKKQTKTGKWMAKCSAGGWDFQSKQATGCNFVLWLKSKDEVITDAMWTKEQLKNF